MDPYPASPEPAYDPNDKGPRPASVDTAVKLIWASVALSIVSTLLSFVLIDDIVDEQLAGSGLTESQARGTLIGTLVVSAIIGIAISALLATFIGRGANWARIVYTVLAVIGILLSLIGLGSQPVIFLVLGLVSLVLSIATLSFLYRSESNAYFASKPVA